MTTKDLDRDGLKAAIKALEEAGAVVPMRDKRPDDEAYEAYARAAILAYKASIAIRDNAGEVVAFEDGRGPETGFLIGFGRIGMNGEVAIIQQFFGSKHGPTTGVIRQIQKESLFDLSDIYRRKKSWASVQHLKDQLKQEEDRRSASLLEPQHDH